MRACCARPKSIRSKKSAHGSGDLCVGKQKQKTLSSTAAPGSASFRQTQFCQNLFGRRVPEYRHRVGSGRNCGEPIARLRDTGGSRHHVAHLLHGPLGRLLCRPQDHVFAWLCKCRCAKCERERSTCTSNRPAAHATEPASCFHASIVIPFQIYASLFAATFRTKKRHFRPRTPPTDSRLKAGVNPPKENVPIAGG